MSGFFERLVARGSPRSTALRLRRPSAFEARVDTHDVHDHAPELPGWRAPDVDVGDRHDQPVLGMSAAPAAAARADPPSPGSLASAPAATEVQTVQSQPDEVADARTIRAAPSRRTPEEPRPMPRPVPPRPPLRTGVQPPAVARTETGPLGTGFATSGGSLPRSAEPEAAPGSSPPDVGLTEPELHAEVRAALLRQGVLDGSGQMAAGDHGPERSRARAVDRVPPARVTVSPPQSRKSGRQVHVHIERVEVHPPPPATPPHTPPPDATRQPPRERTPVDHGDYLSRQAGRSGRP